MSPFPGREALQPERTALAWQRTSISSMVLLVPMVVVALRISRPAVAVACAAGLAASGWLVRFVRLRFRQLHDDAPVHTPFTPMWQVAASTVLGAMGGVVVALALVLR